MRLFTICAILAATASSALAGILEALQTGSEPHSARALPSSFAWSSSQPLIYPQNDGHNITALKDPSVIYYNGAYHVFVSTVSDAEGYNMAYLTFTDFNSAESATIHYLDATAIGTGYRAAPQVFYMTTQSLWYLIFQDGNAGYSTNPDITNPNGWSAVKDFFTSVPTIVSDNWTGGWLDMWVICDDTDCYHFSEDDNGHVYRAQTTIEDFPNGMGNVVIALEDSDPYNLFEASNVYKVGSQYLLIVECIGSTGHRYFRSWTATTLSGTWTPLAATESNPFAGAANVVFPGGTWTEDISHGEAIRTNVDQTMTLDSSCGPTQYLYQGLPTGSSESYNDLPWKLALLTSTSCTGTTTTTTTTKASSTTTKASTTSTKTTTSASSTASTVAEYGQCGGIGYTGSTVCASPYTCTYSNAYYSQCL
ncbi:glycosyl hydrolase family 62 protein [Clavulina sp. PMI_390]|nr:glycosyl hydrolase family 62 protein [Clavulina sp. PMI_390]